MSEEVKTTVTVYFTVPSDKTAEQYIEELEKLCPEKLWEKVDDYIFDKLEYNDEFKI